LFAIGFIDFVRARQNADTNAMLFGGLRPDTYGNFAKYPLKRFREQYLPKKMDLGARQSFYSLRHCFRDALRRIDAPPDVLQALGGWSQGKLVSDDYGDKCDPDYLVKYMNRVSVPGLNLEFLHVTPD
jgi:integrase